MSYRLLLLSTTKNYPVAIFWISHKRFYSQSTITRRKKKEAEQENNKICQKNVCIRGEAECFRYRNFLWLPPPNERRNLISCDKNIFCAALVFASAGTEKCYSRASREFMANGAFSTQIYSTQNCTAAAALNLTKPFSTAG